MYEKEQNIFFFENRHLLVYWIREMGCVPREKGEKSDDDGIDGLYYEYECIVMIPETLANAGRRPQPR